MLFRSDNNNSPAVVRLYTGPYKGAVLKASQAKLGGDGVVIHMTTMYWNRKNYRVDAYALKDDTLMVNVATDVNHHYMSRILLPSIAAGIGKAGNPNTMQGVTPGMACGPATDAINCGSTIVTAGGIDTHVHSICPQIDNTALAGGCTTLVAGGFGPTDGTNATTVTSGVWNVEQMLRSMEAMPDRKSVV